MPETLNIAARPGLVAVARIAVRNILEGTPRLDDAELIMSELVTNSILWSRSEEIVVVIDNDTPGRARLEVHDDGPDPHARHGDPEAHGRGLLLVDRIADKWGHDAERGVREVWWAELSWS